MRRLSPLLVAATALLSAPAGALSPADLYAAVAPSVWRVVTYDADGLPMGQGSAVVIDTHTLITNCHVLAKARRVSVQQGKTKFDARLELWDPERDLCRLKAPGLQARAIPAVASAQLRVGQSAYAIGNPRGLESTLSAGLVSSLRRDEAERVVLIQTTAPISPGSSGGGLFDEHGRLIGVTTLGSVTGDAQNLNFAVPAEWIAELPARHAKLNRPDPAVQPPARNPLLARVPADAEPPTGPQPWRRGDEIEYRITDRFTGNVRRAVYRVDRVEADKVVFNDGARTESLQGRLVELAGVVAGDMDLMCPPGGWVVDDASTPTGWSRRFERTDGGVRSSFDLDGRFEGEATISTPAGEYRAKVFSYEGWGRRSTMNTGAGIPVRVKIRVWYAVPLHRVVRFESDVVPSANGTFAYLASRETAELVRLRRER